MRTKTEGHFAKDIFLGTFLTVTKRTKKQRRENIFLFKGTRNYSFQ